MTTWVIPCRYDPIVHDCIAGIRKHFPDDRIILVDSCSPDPSYLTGLDVDRVILGNQHYATNAWALAYRAEPDTERWALIHDSLIVHSPWEPVGDVQTVRWFVERTGHDPIMAAFIDHHARRMGIEVPPAYRGVFGPLLFCDGEVLDDLDWLGLFDALPTTKVEASAMERLVGLALVYLGFDVTESLQGEMVDFWGAYDTTHVEKVYRDRQ